jgi:hypothetical protein
MLLLKNICNNRKYSNKERRKEVVRPLTNYNVLVLDQRFRQNSSVSFVNTNTTEMDFRDANVSALLFDLSKQIHITYMVILNTVYNAIEDYNGFKTSLNFIKTSGKYRYSSPEDIPPETMTTMIWE